MQAQDREEFESQMAQLCAGYDKPIGDRVAAYWTSLKPMGLIEFVEIVEFALSPQGPKKMPTAHELWDLRASMQRVRVVIDQAPRLVEEGVWLRHVNGFFLCYVFKRRVVHGNVDPIDMPGIRRQCRELAAWYQGLADERDPDATVEHARRAFDAMMVRIDPKGLVRPNLIADLVECVQAMTDSGTKPMPRMIERTVLEEVADIPIEVWDAFKAQAPAMDDEEGLPDVAPDEEGMPELPADWHEDDLPEFMRA